VFFLRHWISEVTSAMFLSCIPKKMSLQLSSEQSIGDIWIAQLDQKRAPQARFSGCKSSVAVTA